MHRKSIASLIALVAISIPLFASAAGLGVLTPFGGRIVLTEPCNNGLLLTVQEPFGVAELMWNDGELPYLMHVIPHIGQYVLGMAGVNETCTLGPYTIGSGKLIMYHGDSS